MGKPKYIFLGATKFSEETLIFLIENGFKPEAIFFIPEEFKISWSKEPVKNFLYADLRKIGMNQNIPCFEVNSVEGKRLKDYYSLIKGFDLDLILALGWYYMVPKSIRKLARYGAWGIHASLLPKYAGGAPLVWAIIEGERETGVTLFRFDDGVDDGDIIAQKSFFIEESDSINEVYKKAISASKEILIEVFRNFSEVKFKKQDKSKIKIYPQRKPEDGLLDWDKTCEEIYNFIRAQTKPYPCAFSYIRDYKLKFIRARKTKIPSDKYTPGEVVSILDEIFVATKDFFIKLEEVEDENGNIYQFKDYANKFYLVGEHFKNSKIGNLVKFVKSH